MGARLPSSQGVNSKTSLHPAVWTSQRSGFASLQSRSACVFLSLAHLKSLQKRGFSEMSCTPNREIMMASDWQQRIQHRASLVIVFKMSFCFVCDMFARYCYHEYADPTKWIGDILCFVKLLNGVYVSPWYYLFFEIMTWISLENHLVSKFSEVIL